MTQSSHAIIIQAHYQLITSLFTFKADRLILSAKSHVQPFQMNKSDLRMLTENVCGVHMKGPCAVTTNNLRTFREV